MKPSLKETLRQLPKVDLHRHIEGSVRPGTLAEICRSHHIALPTYDAHDLTSILRLSAPADNLMGFLQPFRIIKLCFTDREAISRITFETVEDAWLDNVELLELRFSPEFMAFYHALSLSDVIGGIVDGVREARRLPIKVGLIVSVSRNLTAETMGMPWPTPLEIARTAVEYSDRGVVGLDLSGLEHGYPPVWFKEAFHYAQNAGLGITVHAGEDDGPESVKSAIEDLSAQRIGHGVRVVGDLGVVQLAVEHEITFEICPTSNVLTHAVKSLEEHPLRQLYEAGARVTINTDDPTLCGVTLSDEYALVVERLGLGMNDLARMIETAREASFLTNL